MTPRIYNEVATKLADIWGGYAGWAHTARIYSKLPSFFQVIDSLFLRYFLPRI